MRQSHSTSSQLKTKPIEQGCRLTSCQTLRVGYGQTGSTLPITEYIAVLQPLEHSTERLRGFWRHSINGALIELLCLFHGLMDELDTHLQTLELVD